jgi:flagellar motility protein MotE (MotC chaperone)
MTMRLRPRLLPTVAIAATILLGFKVADLAMGDAATMTPKAQAQPASPPATPPAAAPKPAPKEAQAKAADTASHDSASSDSTSSSDSQPIDPQGLTPSEIDVLQQLSQRRAALDRRAGELDQRDVVLQAAEKRIDEKIAKLEELQKGIARDVQKRSAEDDARLQSLVKIYEAMKPKDAAQIFEQLDMPVLLSVLQRMKELKTSAILAAMDPMKAKAITTALASKRGNDAAPGTARNAAGAPAPKL